MIRQCLLGGVFLAALVSSRPSTAQTVFAGCLDENRPPAARLDSCSALVAANAAGPQRALALFGRAQARMEILEAAPADPPPSAYDPVLADLDASFAASRNERALSLRAVVRFHRGDLAPALLPLFRNGQWEEAAQRLAPIIAAAPADPHPLLLRATFRRMTGNQAGAEQDRQAALRIAAAAP